jgi:ribosome-associated protein
MQEFNLTSENIELIKLLKLLGIAETGGHAKILIDDGDVLLNGKTEFRKRAKLKPGDEVQVYDKKIVIREATI